MYSKIGELNLGAFSRNDYMLIKTRLFLWGFFDVFEARLLGAMLRLINSFIYLQ